MLNPLATRHPAGRCWLAFLLLPVFLLCTLAADAQSFRKGCRKFKRGKLERAEKIFKKYERHATYDLGAEFYLLRLRNKRLRQLGDWARADREFAALAAGFEDASPEKLAKLKKSKVTQRRVNNARKPYQRRAIQLADRQHDVFLLDSITGLFPVWLPDLQDDWDTARTHVVAYNIRTQDYDTATAILNGHLDVVPPNQYFRVWRMRDNIWNWFEAKHPLCRMNRFRDDHSWHAYSRDCWFEEARQAFCHESLDSLLAFHQRERYTVLEFEVIQAILARADNAALSRLSPANQQYVETLQLLGELRRLSKGCGQLDSVAFSNNLDRYLRAFAPRFSAYVLLQDATGYYLRQGHLPSALQLLTAVQPLFPDSAVCASNFYFQTEKQPWMARYVACLPIQIATRSSVHALPHWDARDTQEYSAVSWDEGNEVYFLRRDGKKRHTVVRSLRQPGGEWAAPLTVPTLSQVPKIEPLSLTADGLQMLLRSGRRLYLSQRDHEAAAWSVPEKLPLTGRLGRAVLAPDGSAILAEISDAPRLLEAPSSDLYYFPIDAAGNLDVVPHRLGSEINTTGRESNPYLCADGRTLYFCSDGHDGFGELDVFVARRQGSGWNNWTAPENLGCGTNTPEDEYGFTWAPANGQGAYFTRIDLCNKDLEIWQTDLPAFVLPPPATQLRGVVLNSQGKPIVNGIVNITLDSSTQANALTLSASGQYSLRVPDSTAQVRIYVEAPGYFTPNDTLHQLGLFPVGAVIRDTFRLRSYGEIMRNFQLQYATFDENRIILNDPRVYKELEMLALFATRLKVTMRFIGHTDNTGDPEPNRKLSIARAEAVRQYLIVNFKIPEKRLIAEGRGDTEPKCPNNTKAGRQCNRRVEVKFENLPSASRPLPRPVLATGQQTEGPSPATQPAAKIVVRKIVVPKPKPEVNAELAAGQKAVKKRRTLWQKIFGGKRKAAPTAPAANDDADGAEEEDQ